MIGLHKPIQLKNVCKFSDKLKIGIQLKIVWNAFSWQIGRIYSFAKSYLKHNSVVIRKWSQSLSKFNLVPPSAITWPKSDFYQHRKWIESSIQISWIIKTLIKSRKKIPFSIPIVTLRQIQRAPKIIQSNELEKSRRFN